MRARRLAVALAATVFVAWQFVALGAGLRARVPRAEAVAWVPHTSDARTRAGASPGPMPGGVAGSGGSTELRSAETFGLDRPETTVVFAPHRYVRGSSGSTTYFAETITLPGFGSGKRYLMRIRNGDTTGANAGRASQATVQVNGKEVMSASDLTASIASCIKLIQATATTTLLVGVTGASGRYVDVTLWETPDPSYNVRSPQTFVMAEPPDPVPPGGPYTEFTEEVSRGSGDTGPYAIVVDNGLPDGTLRCSGVKVYLDGTQVVSSSQVNVNVAQLVRQVSLPNLVTSLTVRVYGSTGAQATIRFTATDATQPVLAVTSPLPGFATTHDTASVRVHLSDETVMDSVLVQGVPASYLGNDATGTLWTGVATLPAVDGRYPVTVRARNRAGYAVDSVRVLTRDTTAPTLTVSAPAAGGVQTSAEFIAVAGTWTDLTRTTIFVDGDSVAAAVDSGSFHARVPLDLGSNGIHLRARDLFGHVTEFKRYVQRVAADEPVAIDSTIMAPSMAETEASSFWSQVRFLWAASPPLQSGVDTTQLASDRLAVIRGRVLARDLGPLANVVVGVLGHAEYGTTLTRADGQFDLAVNGGAPLTLRFTKDGFLESQRVIDTAVLDHSQLDDVAMLGRSARQYAVNTSSPQKVVSRFETDANGDRRLTLLFAPGTHCTVSGNGQPNTLTQFSVRAKEYTVGASGDEAMPGTLPPSTAYTYCVNLSVVEAEALTTSGGASPRITFDQPVVSYVREFLGVPVGSSVPSGSYDLVTGAWVASEDGVVVRLINRSAGRSNLDTDGNGTPDSTSRYVALGITDTEANLIADEYAPGDSLWRVRLDHFSAHDYNFNRAAVDAARGQNPAAVTPFGTLITDPGLTCACVIENENRVLGQSIPVTGTPYSLNYRSSRQSGDVAMRWLRIPLVGSSVPASLVRVHVTVDVAGRRFEHIENSPLVGATWEFKGWDGTDVYGRPVRGAIAATVRRGYEFMEKMAVSTGGGSSFGNGARSSPTGINPAGERAVGRIFWSTQKVSIGVPSMAAAGLGGWNISPHHIYDPNGMGMKYRGDGSLQQGAGQFPVIRRWAGTGASNNTARQGANPLAVSIIPTGQISVGADGALYVANDAANADDVSRIARDGQVERFAGGGTVSFYGGVRADSIRLVAPRSPIVAPDGSVYFIDGDASVRRVYRVTPGSAQARRVWHFAGNSALPYADDSLATRVGITGLNALALGPDAAVFIGGTLGSTPVILRVGPDGRISRYAGAGGGQPGSDGKARSINILVPNGMVCDADGSLYFTEQQSSGSIDRIRRITPDGQLSTIQSGAGLMPSSLAIGPDGALYFSQNLVLGDLGRGAQAVYRIESDGTRTLVAGGHAGAGSWNAANDGIHALGALFAGIEAIALDPSGHLYIGQKWSGGDGYGIFQVHTELPTQAFDEVAFPAEDGRTVDLFTTTGRHLRTVDAITGDTLYRFGYNLSGQLTSITDFNHDVTEIVRANGVPTQIVAPRGQVTALSLDAGYLHTVTNPASETVTLGYEGDGLLTSFSNARGAEWIYHFSAADGRLDYEAAPAEGGGQDPKHRQFGQGELGATRSVTQTSPEGRVTTHNITQMLDGLRRRLVRRPDGSEEYSDTRFRAVTPYGQQDSTASSTGAVTISRPARDARHGWWAPVDSFEAVTLPVSHQRRVVARTRTWGASQFEDHTWVNGKLFTSTYDLAQRQLTTKTPLDRTTIATFDGAGRPTHVQAPGLADVVLGYDAFGRLQTLTQGTRAWHYDYDDLGQLQSVYNQSGDSTRYEHDPASRVTALDLPGARRVEFGYDAAGNMDTLRTPNGHAHAFTYYPVNLNQAYLPPTVADVPNPMTAYAYDSDQQLTSITRPDGGIVDLAYGVASGKLERIEFPDAGSVSPRARTEFTYRAGSSASGAGLLASADRLGHASVEYGYDGSLPTSEQWRGRVQGTVSMTYDEFFRPKTETVGAGAVARAVTFGYDDDGLLTSATAGDASWSYAIHRNSATGAADSTQVGAIRSSVDFNPYGELQNLRYTIGGQELFHQSITHDDRGQVSRILERWYGVAVKATEYGYDAAGRLSRVTVAGQVLRDYGYDPNGNRTSETAPLPGGGTTAYAGGAYDEQDRLLRYGLRAIPEPAGSSWATGGGPRAYRYTANGELAEEDMGGYGPTAYFTYDALGNLLKSRLPQYSETLPDSLEYVIDGQSRRVGVRRNGTFERGWLYDGIAVLAEMSDSVTLRHRYVYGTQGHVPDLLWRGDSSIVYRLVTDQLGSVRAVVRASDGAVLQRTDYDAWGVITADTNGTFQGLGYAGGLTDRATGLVRFGARDYDPGVGRWTCKDPIGFVGGELSLYGYNGSSPQAGVDPEGLGHFRRRPIKGTGGITTPDGAEPLDKCNCEFLHEQFFYDNEDNVGYFKGAGTLGSAKGRVGRDEPDQVKQYGPPEPAYYDDDTMRRAAANLKKLYEARVFGLLLNNCQRFNDALRREYERLMDGPHGNR